MESYYHRLQAIFISSNRWLVGLAVVALCLLIGLVGGALIAYLSPVLTAALVVAIAAGLVMLRSAEAGIFALVGVICLLPFAALPIKIGFSPTLLDLVPGVLFVVWLAKLLAGRAEARLGRHPLARSLWPPRWPCPSWPSFSWPSSPSWLAWDTPAPLPARCAASPRSSLA